MDRHLFHLYGLNNQAMLSALAKCWQPESLTRSGPKSRRFSAERAYPVEPCQSPCPAPMRRRAGFTRTEHATRQTVDSTPLPSAVTPNPAHDPRKPPQSGSPKIQQRIRRPRAQRLLN